jgi:hypothetical protein
MNNQDLSLKEYLISFYIEKLYKILETLQVAKKDFNISIKVEKNTCIVDYQWLDVKQSFTCDYEIESIIHSLFNIVYIIAILKAVKE